ncbi:hypothetical protein CSW58_06865 [Caulobacter sp. B11]|nr:hypothetical protein CSW58_06865 [Caulobacter sp. B11]
MTIVSKKAEKATPAAPAKGGKAAKAPKHRSGFADFMTLMISVACTVWAFKTIIALGAQSF